MQKGSKQNQEPKKQKLKVFIGGLPPGINEAELRDQLKYLGSIKSCEIIKDVKTQEPRGFAFIIFKDNSSYLQAINNPQFIKGR